MNKQLKSFITTAGTLVSLVAITFTAAAATPKVNADNLAGSARQVPSQQPLVYAPAAACTKLQAGDVYWMGTDPDTGEVTGTVDMYPSGTPTITAAFDYNCIPSRTKLGVVWSIDGEQVYTSNETPKANAKADTYTYSLFKKDASALDDGEYGVEFYLGQNLLTSGTITVGGEVSPTEVVTDTKGTTDTATDVSVQGKVVDKQSKKPINGALIVVLNEGVDAKEWLDSGTDSDVMAYAKTDSTGEFELNERIPVGTALPWLIGAKGYQTIIDQEFAIDPSNAEDPYVMNIGLVRSK